MSDNGFIDLEATYSAHNYEPLPVVAESARGAWIVDTEGDSYLDMLAGYSALNFGHRSPRLIEAMAAQLNRLTLTSRAIHNDQLGLFGRDLCELLGYEKMLPMNTGAEAVETALKLARKWGYERKGIPKGEAVILVMNDNFHGRTISIVSFSSDFTASGGFAPYTPGFHSVPFGDAELLEAILAGNGQKTAAVLLEPIQGEAGVIIPPQGYLAQVRRICTENNVLMIADEIQSGLGRTGRTLAVDHEQVRPDVLILGKALGGGLLPISAVLADNDVMDVLTPGTHGSTFGGNPLACAVAREVVSWLGEGTIQQRTRKLGWTFSAALEAIGERTGAISGIRSRGLWAGIDIGIPGVSGRDVAEALLQRRVIAKDTHGQTIRLAPPLTISERGLLWGLDQLEDALRSF